MKTFYTSVFAILILANQAISQVVVQQQTVTTTYQQSVPGFQMQFNAFTPFYNSQQNQMFWDPATSSYIQLAPNQQIIYVDQFGNPVQVVQQQNQYVYLDQFGNPVQPMQQIVYVDQFGNPIIQPVQPNQQITHQVIYYDQFGNPIYQQVCADPAVYPVNPQTQIYPVNPQTQVYPANPTTVVSPTQYVNNSPVNMISAMDMGAFANVLNQLHNQSFESTRLTLAKQILNSNYFTSEQIRQIMTQMTFEDSKVEIARYGNSRVVDPQNYFTVNSAFTFSSSVDELNRYLYGR
ncbi:MAG: DUF4476 domain-containing protein [Bacteroidia bacterium]